MTQLGIAPKQAVRHHKGNLWHFSEEEKRHLLLATGAFTSRWASCGCAALADCSPLLHPRCGC